MDGDQITEDERQGLLNQIRLDLLLRRLGSTVLRRKFKEIYAKLNDGKEWKDGPEAGEKFCRSNLGNGAFTYANVKQQEMMKGGNIELWDLNCLQSVITQMLAAALKAGQENNNSQATPINWDQRWWAQMSKIRTLANIRHSIAHMPNETLSQDEFDEKWENAVDSLKVLGAKSKEIKKILQMCQSAMSLPSLEQQGQGQLPNSQNEGVENIEESTKEEKKTIAELRAKIKELQLQNQNKVKDQDETKDQKSKDKIKGQFNNDSKIVNPIVLSTKNELRADSLTRRGDLAGRSGDWDKALDFYTQALEILEISDDQRKNIYMNRSWVHLRILQMPERPRNFNFKLPESRDSESKTKLYLIPPSQNPIVIRRKPKFVDENLLNMDQGKQSQKITNKLKEFHLTAGIADAESALQLSSGQKSPKALYRLAQFHHLKGDWKTALTFFDHALGQSELDDSQLEFDRNVIQLELLNQTEVEEFDWIPGKKNQTMAGLAVRQDPQKWSKVLDNKTNDPQQQLYAQVVKAHFLAQGLSSEKQGQNTQKVTQQTFVEVVKLYEGAGNEGLPSGIYNLGLLLQEGNGVQKDFSDAVRLFKMAAQFPINDKTPDWAKDGILEAQYRLGLCHEFGLGVGKDDRKALHWYEMAGGGGYPKASKKLGDIYSQGLLGVSKDHSAALLCWNYATIYAGERNPELSTCLFTLTSFILNRRLLMVSIESFSNAIVRYSQGGRPNLLASILDQKRKCEHAIAIALQTLIERSYSPYPGDIMETGMDIYDRKEIDEPEPDEVSWNVPALVEHTLHKIHLLELVQGPEFQQKMKANPSYNKQLNFTHRLVTASTSCYNGLAAFQELNKLYREALIKGGPSDMEIEYPPDLRKIPGVDQATLDREGQLWAIILESFFTSIMWVGCAYFMDEPSQSLILGLCLQIGVLPVSKTGPVSKETITQEGKNCGLANLISSYIFLAIGHKCEEKLKEILPADKPAWLLGGFVVLSSTAVKGTLGKFEEAAADIEEFLNSSIELPFKSDFLFVQALCCKSAGLTRGINSANRKKIKEAMAIFQEFLSICPKDDPRRAEAHYQLGLCTFYLEKMKVKGQVKSSVKDILAKVLPHYIQGEKAERDLPWKEFNLNYKPPVKLILQQKMKELKPSSGKKVSTQNLTPDSEGESEKLDILCAGRLVDPFFLFHPSSFPLKIRSRRRVQIVTAYRRFFKSTKDAIQQLSSLSAVQLAEFLRLKSPFSGGDVLSLGITNAYLEIVDPILYFRMAEKQHPELNKIVAFTVVQDDSGNVFNLKLIMKHPRGTDKLSKVEELQMGDRIILHRPCVRLDADGGTSLVVKDVPEQVFQLPVVSKVQEQESGGGHTKMESKCGYCGKMGEALQRCSKCQAVFYCGKECQMADWNELKHKWICPFLKCDCQFCQKKG